MDCYGTRLGDWVRSTEISPELKLNFFVFGPGKTKRYSLGVGSKSVKDLHLASG